MQRGRAERTGDQRRTTRAIAPGPGGLKLAPDQGSEVPPPMSTTLRARLYASTTALTLGGLILAMGAPLKWGAMVVTHLTG